MVVRIVGRTQVFKGQYHTDWTRRISVVVSMSDMSDKIVASNYIWMMKTVWMRTRRYFPKGSLRMRYLRSEIDAILAQWHQCAWARADHRTALKCLSRTIYSPVQPHHASSSVRELHSIPSDHRHPSMCHGSITSCMAWTQHTRHPHLHFAT